MNVKTFEEVWWTLTYPQRIDLVDAPEHYLFCGCSYREFPNGLAKHGPMRVFTTCYEHADSDFLTLLALTQKGA